MDKVPPARQTRSRPMTIEAGPSYFSHDGEAQCVLSNLAASRPVSVARKASLWPPVDLPCWSAISLRICPAPLGALSSHETTSCQAAVAAADLHQRIKTFFLKKT
jgi:hypothetical protein